MTHSVSYDSRCYYIDDKPVWLVSGAIHYFRVPNELWEDRIRKAKLAGLNCIETYVCWNLHEPREGVFDFTGNLDLDRFLTLIEQAGLYAIVRPGPYICSEWDNGGIPAWLSCKPGVRLRENEPQYLNALESFFDRLLPIIAKHQVTRGRGVILVQNENEYMFEDRPGGTEHLQHLNGKLRLSEIDVPIIVCNHLKARIDDAIECWNCWDGITGGINSIRTVQPDAPKMITEFWNGWFEYWGQPAGENIKTGAMTFRRNCEILGSGAMWNYYMWHGGTNFGFTAGRTTPHSMGAVTTSYDSGAPLSETGQTTEKLLFTKTANWMAQSWSQFLCKASPVTSSATVEGPFILQQLQSGAQSLLIVRTQDDNQSETLARIHLPGGKELSVDLSDMSAAILPVEVIGSKNRTIDYTNGACFCPDLMLFFGPAGTEGVVSINGEEIYFNYPTDDQPHKLQAPNGEITIMSCDGINKMWFLEDYSIVYGAADFPETPGRPLACSPSPVFRERESVGEGFSTCVPKLSNWQIYSFFPALHGEGDWTTMDAPKSMDEMGHCFGYGWYRCEFDSTEDRTTNLYFPFSGDRLLTFLNGSYIGTYGRGTGASPKPLEVTFTQGKNTLVFLADNMGRANFGKKLGEKKGIWGDVGLDWQIVPTPERTEPSNGVPDQAKDGWELKTIWFELPQESRSVVWDLDLAEDESLHLGIYDLHQIAYIFVNGKLTHQHMTTHSIWSDLGYNEFPLDDFVQPGKNKVELRILGLPEDALPTGFTLYKLKTDNILKGKWSFMPFDPKQAKEGDDHTQPLRIYKVFFDAPEVYSPLFLDFTTLGKGHVYLNGKPLGRYWSIGPQKKLYIPEPWVRAKNELVIFEEQGHSPEGVTINGR